MRGKLTLSLRYLAFACLCASAFAGAQPAWVVVRDSRFEVYSRQSESAARHALRKLEWLRILAERQAGWSAPSDHRLRVIGFRSAEEYAAYRPQPLSDGYYAGLGNRGYIVLPGLGAEHDAALAHEYAHALVHTAGFSPPAWFNEGFAEVFSAMSTAPQAGDVPARLQMLGERPWLPLSQLVSLDADSPLLVNRGRAEMFYAQCWALTEMLLRAPGYAPRFASLVTAVGGGTADAGTLERIYGKSPEEISSDLHAWIGRLPADVAPRPPAPVAETAVEARPVNPFEMQLVLADLMLTSRQFDRAEAIFGQLARQAPGRPEPFGGLGVVAMSRANGDAARGWWKRALELGLGDGDICYRYAALLDAAGVTGAELRAALERTLALRPDLDDAHWRLAMLEENEGHDAASLAQLRAMKVIPPQRAHAYWRAVANAQLGLGRNEEAASAAAKAFELAQTPEEHALAAGIQYTARTHLDVQFHSDPSGRQEMVTTRVPNGVADWNPFIEPGDEIRRVSGALQQLDCAADGIQITVETASGPLRLAVPDPRRVRILHGPADFTCGAQPAVAVTVDYAAKPGAQGGGVVRGIEFRQ